MIVGIILALIGIITLIIGISIIKKAHTINIEISKENNEIENKNVLLKNEQNKILTEKNEAEKDLFAAIKLVDEKQKQFREENNKLKELKENIDNIYKDKEEMSRKAFESFCDILDIDYNKKAEEYDKLILQLDKIYSDKQNKLLIDLDKVKAELDDIKKKRTAAIEAQIREKEIKTDMSFYCLIPGRNDLQDYDKINSLRPMLNNGRILSMLLWQTYYQPLAKKQFPQILGTSATVTGIYKITNQITNQCYIGQAVNIDTRWKDHCKAGLGIDTPAGNKLYKAMQEYGLYNFSWEVLEKCPKEKLNEREKYFIDLYDSYNYGYNSNKGVSK